MLNSLAIDITNHCNFNCIHCIRDTLSPRAHLAPELLEYVLQEIASLGIKETSLTGGELALHPELKEIFRLHTAYDIRFNFVSNGFLFLEKVLPLLDSKTRGYLTSICFSLDGATARSHDMIRKKGGFAQVLKSITRCLKEGIPVSVKSIVHRKNVKEIPDIAFLCASMGVESLGFIILTPAPRLLTSGLMPSPEEYEEVVKYIKNQIVPAFSMRIDVEGYSDPDFKAGFCNPFHGISMDHQGNLIFCCNLSHPTAKDRPDTFGKEFLGNITEIGIEEGILRHYRLMGWFMEKVINANVTKQTGSNCTDCFQLFGKMEWIKDYESPYNRNC